MGQIDLSSESAKHRFADSQEPSCARLEHSQQSQLSVVLLFFDFSQSFAVNTLGRSWTRF